MRVVWLPGWAHTSADFAESARLLGARGVASVAFDLPGFGASPAPDAPVGARGYAELVAPALAEVADEPVVIVGHSFGGCVGLALAARHPERVRGLVITASPLLRGPGRRPAWRFRAVRALARHGLVSEARLEAARDRHGSPDYRAAHGVMRQVFVASVQESFEDELATWRGPTALVWGDRDTEVPMAVADRAAAQLSEPPRIHRLAGVGHQTPTAAPDELAAVAAAML